MYISLIFFQTNTKFALCFGDTMKLNSVHISGGNQKGIAKAVEKVNLAVPVNFSIYREFVMGSVVTEHQLLIHWL